MPPKAKANAKPKAVKTSTSADDLNKKQSSNKLNNKDNYSIFVLNVETDSAQSILKAFIAKAKDRERRVVVPLVIQDEIIEEISLEKAPEKISNVEVSVGEIFEKTTIKKSPDEMFEEARIEIAKCIKDDESLNEQLLALKTADLLEIWQKGTTGDVKKGRASSGKAAGKSEKPSVAKGDKGKKDTKGKKSDAKSMKSENIDGDGCHLGAIPRIDLESRPGSKFNPENKDNKIRITYIEDHPEPGPGLYIIIIGTFNADFCLRFIREKYPLSGFISICPRDENADHPFESVCNELERFDETKPIAMKNIVFPNLTKCNAEDRKQDIYDQISWLFYDIERAKRQHTFYLSQLNEIDVEMKGQFPRKSKTKFLTTSSLPEKSLDCIIVPIYLDNLLDAVADIIDEQSRRQSADELGTNLGKVPLYLEEHKVQVIHHRNEILKCMIADEGLDNVIYNRCIEIVNKYSMIKKIWNTCRNNNRNSINTLDTIRTISSDIGSAITLEMPDNDKIYLELITQHATGQRLNELYDNYDTYLVQYCNARNEVNVNFSNTYEQYFEVLESNWIPTKVCFRDYYKYVADKIEEWNKEQEIINEVKIISEKRRKSMKLIPDEDFIFNPSLKRTTKETAAPEIIHSQEGDIKSTKTVPEITPTSRDSIAQEYQPKIKIPLIAYNIGDTYYEIKTSRIKFRTTSGSVKIVEDKFTSGSLQLAIDLDYFGNHLLYNHTKPLAANPPFVKLILSNSTAINFHVIYPFDNPTEDLFQTEAESGIVAYFETQIFWPTGLQINVINDRQTGELIAITQIPPKGNEMKRFYFPNGIVAIYYNDGLIDVLTACGTSYEGVMRDTSMSNVHHIYGGDYIEEDGVLLHKQPRWYYTMRQFEKLNIKIQKKSYKFDSCDGYSFEVVSGQLALENKQKYVKEWWDYAAGECYATVEGGIKTRLHGNTYEVYYPNKTLITTFTEDFVLDDNPLTEEGDNTEIIDTEEEEEDQKENDIIDTSAMKIAGKLLEKILENAGRDRYITYNRTYLIHSENYAAIHFDKNQTKIFLQDETKIVFQNNTLQINIKDEFVVNCDAERCTISGCKYRDQNNFIKAFINLIPGKEPLLEVQSGIDAVLKISQNGKRTYISKAGQCHPKCIIPEDVNFILDKYFSGYELCDKFNVMNVMACERHPICIKASSASNEIETLLQPLQTIQKEYKLEIPGIKQFLGKFVNEGPSCEPVWKTSPGENHELPDLMSIRSFLSASYYLNQEDLSTVVQISKRLSSLEDFICIDDSESVFRFLKYQATIAIKRHLAEIDAKLEKSLKVKKTLDFHSKYALSRDRKRRMEIYKQTLRTKFFPKYEDFKKVDYNVKIMDFDRYKPLINKLEGRTSTSSMDITEKFLLMQSTQSNDTTDTFIDSTSQAL